MLAAQRSPAETDLLMTDQGLDSRKSAKTQTRNSQRQLSASSNTVPHKCTRIAQSCIAATSRSCQLEARARPRPSFLDSQVASVRHAAVSAAAGAGRNATCQRQSEVTLDFCLLLNAFVKYMLGHLVLSGKPVHPRGVLLAGSLLNKSAGL